MTNNQRQSNVMLQDPLLNECSGIQQRLRASEKSILNLSMSSVASCKTSDDMATVPKVSSPRPETVAPILTLADLTPTCSDNSVDEECVTLARESPHQGSSSASNDKQRRNKHGLQDDKVNHTALLLLREENSVLFTQNNKLMSKLESAMFHLQQQRNETKSLRESRNMEKMDALKDQLSKKDYAIKQLEELVVKLRLLIKTDEDEHDKQNDEVNMLQEHVQTLQQHVDSLEAKNSCLEEENTDLISLLEEEQSKNESFQNENEKMRSDVSATNMVNIKLQAQIKAIVKESEENKENQKKFNVENDMLNGVVQHQKTKITEYENEVAKTKAQLSQLEELIAKIQNEKLSTSRADSGLGYPMNSCSFDAKDVGSSSQNAVTDLQMQLASKENQIEQLKNLLASNTNWQKQSEPQEINSLHGIRVELTSLIERNRLSDKKQLELEHSISMLREEVSCKTAQIIELTAKDSDKDDMITSLENELTKRNHHMLKLQRDVEKSEQRKLTDSEQLTSLTKKFESHSQRQTQVVRELENQLYNAENEMKRSKEKIVELEKIVFAQDEGTKATETLLSRIKELHGEHCGELEMQISTMQEELEKKTRQCVQLENKQEAIYAAQHAKDESTNNMAGYVNKMEQLLQEKDNVIEELRLELKSSKEAVESESKVVAELKATVLQCQDDMKQVIQKMEYESERHELKERETRTLQITIKNLEADIAIKSNHIENLQRSCQENLSMLEESNKRIVEVEDNHEASVSNLTQSANMERKELQDELLLARKSLMDAESELHLYKGQSHELNRALDDAKLQFVSIGEELRKKEERIVAQTLLVVDKDAQLSNLNRLNEIQVEELNGKTDWIEHLQEEILTRDETILELIEEKSTLEDKLKASHSEGKDVAGKLNECEEKLAALNSENLLKNDAINSCERMLAISQDGLNIKEKELGECHLKMAGLEELLAERGYEVKEKSAHFTQQEMKLKQLLSEHERQVILLKQDLDERDKDLEARKSELAAIQAEILKSRELVKDFEEMNSEKENMLLLQKDANLRSTAELKLLQQELEKCQTELKRQMQSENDVMSLNCELQRLQQLLHVTGNELLISQQTVQQLTQDSDEAREMIALKEADCTRLARELGASHVREGQERARRSEELKTTVKRHQLEMNAQTEQFDLVQEKYDSCVQEQKQRMMNLELALQRRDDENLLSERDLERCRQCVGELENHIKSLTKELQAERHKCRELQDSLILRDAEVARLSARLSGFERSMQNQRNLMDIMSTSSKTTCQPSFSTRVAADNESPRSVKSCIASPVRDFSFGSIDSFNNDSTVEGI